MSKRNIHFSLFISLVGIVAFLLILLVLFIYWGFGSIYKNEIFTEREISTNFYIQNSIKELESKFEYLERLVNSQQKNFVKAWKEKKLQNSEFLFALRFIVKTYPQIIWGCVAECAPDPKIPGNYDINGKYIITDGQLFSIKENKQLLKIFHNHLISAIKNFETPFWSEPFRDPIVGNDYSVMYALPIQKDGQLSAFFCGVFPLTVIERFLEQSDLNRMGAPFFYTNSDLFFQRSDNKWISGHLIGEFSETAPDPETKDYYCRLKKILLSKGDNTVYFNVKNRFIGRRFYYDTFELNGWRMGFETDYGTSHQFQSQESKILILFCGLGIILALLSAYFMIRKIVSPFNDLAAKANDIVSGHFSTPLNSNKSCWEVAELIDSFERMRSNIREYLLKISNAKKEAKTLKVPLKLAGEIQQQLIPRDFSFLQEKNIDFYAKTLHAQEIGGDFYDCRMIDDKNMYFCLGDVSDKGIPGAWFMALGLSFIRVGMFMYRDPGKVLSLVNRQLKKRNGPPLYMSAICGIYSFEKNEVSIACAGFNPPIIVNDEGWSKVTTIGSELPMGILDSTEYTNIRITLMPGEVFFVHSDEILYAMNKEKEECFGKERLLSVLNSAAGKSLETMGRMVLYAVRNFKGTKKQMDDITILLFKHY